MSLLIPTIFLSIVLTSCGHISSEIQRNLREDQALRERETPSWTSESDIIGRPGCLKDEICATGHGDSLLTAKLNAKKLLEDLIKKNELVLSTHVKGQKKLEIQALIPKFRFKGHFKNDQDVYSLASIKIQQIISHLNENAKLSEKNAQDQIQTK